MEPILDPSNNRLTVYPIKYHKIWEFYKKMMASSWTVEEIDLSKDHDDFINLSPEEQKFIKMVLAFFAASDGIVNMNLAKDLFKKFKFRKLLWLMTFKK